jgi:hypothetical protein
MRRSHAENFYTYEWGVTTLINNTSSECSEAAHWSWNSRVWCNTASKEYLLSFLKHSFLPLLLFTSLILCWSPWKWPLAFSHVAYLHFRLRCMFIQISFDSKDNKPGNFCDLYWNLTNPINTSLSCSKLFLRSSTFLRRRNFLPSKFAQLSSILESLWTPRDSNFQSRSTGT